MGLLCGARERGGFDRGSSSRMALKLHSAGTIFLCVSLIAVSLLIFSIVVIETEPVSVPQQPWPSQRPSFTGSTAQRWRALQSSSAPFTRRPDKAVVPVEKALQGMGTLFRRGTQPMRELMVAHLSEETSMSSLRLFLRTLHRSGVTARADVALLFPWATVPPVIAEIIQQEEVSFQMMLALSDPKKKSTQRGSLNPAGISNSTLTPFNTMVFRRAAEEQRVRGDVIWGKRANASQLTSDHQSWSGYGSIVGFEMQELDTHDVLGGFFNNPPAQLRRWVCYEMLLGMVRTKFRNVLLTQVQGVVIVGDAFAPVRRRQSLYVTAEDRLWLDSDAEEFLPLGRESESNEDGSKQEKSSSDGKSNVSAAPGGFVRSSYPTELNFVHRRALKQKDDEAEELGADNMEAKVTTDDPPRQRSTKSKPQMKLVITAGPVKGLIQSVYGSSLWRSLDKEEKDKVVLNSGFAMGRIDYVRGLSNKMATEIVRIALEKKNRQPFHDKAVMNYLVHKSSVLGKRILDHSKVVANRDSVVHSLRGSKQPHAFWRRRVSGPRYAIIQGLNSTGSDSDAKRAHKIMMAVHNDICRSPVDSQVYQDCLYYNAST